MLWGETQRQRGRKENIQIPLQNRVVKNICSRAKRLKLHDSAGVAEDKPGGKFAVSIFVITELQIKVFSGTQGFSFYTTVGYCNSTEMFELSI